KNQRMTHYNARLSGITIPPRIARLPITDTGYPVPWFCQWFDNDGNPCTHGHGKPDLRIMGIGKPQHAVSSRLCWICGDRLGVPLGLNRGRMGRATGIRGERPSPGEGAEFAAHACPFLTQPRMRRNEADKPMTREAPGIMLAHNPGVTCVWVTRSY